MIKKSLLVMCLFASSCALSVEESSPIVGGFNGIIPLGGGSSCVTTNIQGALASGFLGYVEGVGTHAILVDPTGSGAVGDPGCGGDFTNMLFDVTDITFQIADETVFGQPGDGLGVITYEVSIHPFAVSGDATMGPGAAIVTETQIVNADASGLYVVTTPFTAQESLTEPFFVSWKLISFVSTDPNVVNRVTPLWDGEERPLGRQFIDNDGAGFIDHTDFFAAGTTGWIDVVVTGEFRGVIVDADLSLNITNNALGELAIGDVVTFTQTVDNAGPSDANNTVVFSALSSGLTYSSNDCGATVSGSDISWAAGTVANGASSVCNVVATISGFGQQSLTGSVTADETDVVPGNNVGGSNVSGPARVIPTLSFYGVLALMAGMFFVYRRKASIK